jgi:hormone-sensitive lipase
MGEQGLLSKLMPVLFPSIQFNKKIYIDRYFRDVTKPYILSQYERNTINRVNNDVGERVILPK